MLTTPFFATFGRELAGWCGLRPGQRVLDVAAGRGAITLPAARAVGPRGLVVAVDYAPNMRAALARDRGDLPQIKICGMDAHRLAFPDASFDVVTCGLAFHIMHDPERAIVESYRVLRPGGLLAFSEPAPAKPDSRWDFYGELMRDVGERARAERSRRSGAEAAPESFTDPPRPLPELCAEAGLVEQTSALRDPGFPICPSASAASRPMSLLGTLSALMRAGTAAESAIRSRARAACVRTPRSGSSSASVRAGTAAGSSICPSVLAAFSRTPESG